ncbi:MAG: 23S rRNA (pseudouridine(1915)-N(3))-methyltransferase RlmH [Verrucomicrobia bacterium]|nr:23S rRNA (pseudouridine(1915)-N(3))-methyltransferase RlmH [Verrucomicrobiota bacterium]
MYKIKVFSVGKTKEDWLQDALEEYERRLKSSLSFEWILAKNDEQLKQFLEKEAHFICLDPRGKQFTSEEFSCFLVKSLQEMHSRLAFVIGGSEGIPEHLKARARSLISLSRMTFTHQITRLILVEQIYRALEIEKGTAYHK